MSIADKLTLLADTKEALRVKLDLGVDVPFSEYVSYVTAPFYPLDLFKGSKQGVWYDPSDKSTLFQDAAGTVPVTKDGDPVGLMLDKSGNNNHATQTASAARPVYKTDGILHWLFFDGADDYMLTTANHLSKWSVYTASSSGIYSETAVIYGGRSSTNTRSYIGTLDGQVTAGVGATSNHFIKSGVAYVSNTPVVGVYIHDEVSVRVRQDGVDAFLRAQSGTVTPSAVAYVGALNNNGSPVSYFNGKLYGVLAINSMDVYSNTESYLAKKSGVTL